MARAKDNYRTLKNVFLLIGIGGLVASSVDLKFFLIGFGSLAVSCVFQLISENGK
jgi:hypothetical protein